MALVEHITQPAVGWGVVGLAIADAVLIRVRHDERMIGDHHGCMTRAPHALFDETGSIVWTGGIDAFAPPVSQLAQRNRCGEECRKICAREIAVLCRCYP